MHHISYRYIITCILSDKALITYLENSNLIKIYILKMLHLPLQKHRETVKFKMKLKTFNGLHFSLNPYNSNMFSGIIVYNLITKKEEKTFYRVS